MGRLLRSPNKGLFLSSEVATPRLLARSTRQSTRFRTAAQEVEHHWSFWKARYCQVLRPSMMHNVSSSFVRNHSRSQSASFSQFSKFRFQNGLFHIFRPLSDYALIFDEHRT